MGITILKHYHVNDEKQMQPKVKGKKAKHFEKSFADRVEDKQNSPLVALRPMLRPACMALPRSSCCYKTGTGKPKIIIYMELLEGMG